MKLGAVKMAEEGIARRSWKKFANEAVFALYSPFLVCLTAGNLDSQTFRHCFSQEVHFLKAFDKACQSAEDFADDDDDEKMAIRRLRKSLLQELRTHDIFVQEWGFELLPNESISEATAKYTQFLAAIASGERVPCKTVTPFERTKVAAYTLGAIAPCMALYAYLYDVIKARPDPRHNTHPYKNWIQHYSSQDFKASAKQTEDVLDKLTASFTGEELEVIEKLYHQAMKLQLEFFTAQPISQQTVVPLSRVQLTIFCDFDLTCSIVDSSAVLAELAIVTSQRPGVASSECDLKKQWESLSTQYTEEFEQCVENLTRGIPEEAFDRKGLLRALEKVGEFEKKANARVVESGVLKGLSLEQIKLVGHGVLLEIGCRDFFQKIVKNENSNIDVHVISYCWCGDVIKSALSSDINASNIHSNELAYDEQSVTTGKIVKKVESPKEKLEAFREVLKGRKSTEGEHLTVYIGGEVGDLLCLVEADIGIVIGSSSSLRKLGNQFGVLFAPLLHGVVENQIGLAENAGPGRYWSYVWKKHPGVVFTVSSWTDIHAFILGL